MQITALLAQAYPPCSDHLRRKIQGSDREIEQAEAQHGNDEESIEIWNAHSVRLRHRQKIQAS